MFVQIYIYCLNSIAIQRGECYLLTFNNIFCRYLCDFCSLVNNVLILWEQMFFLGRTFSLFCVTPSNNPSRDCSRAWFMWPRENRRYRYDVIFVFIISMLYRVYIGTWNTLFIYIEYLEYFLHSLFCHLLWVVACCPCKYFVIYVSVFINIWY